MLIRYNIRVTVIIDVIAVFATVLFPSRLANVDGLLLQLCPMVARAPAPFITGKSPQYQLASQRFRIYGARVMIIDTTMQTKRWFREAEGAHLRPSGRARCVGSSEATSSPSNIQM
ncbi:hypothetical protein QBC42DRAFT_282545 [Cladorrhinum samala]|uniref:Secreted protein n=1 Tax=Cladorrhinum samala TaxID=585594 RepID=A0AAV9I5B4_9PEZI|nr:hypothetical protein QBC42DRAFT_282545 [Cladorrhinum samala]